MICLLKIMFGVVPVHRTRNDPQSGHEQAVFAAMQRPDRIWAST
jgi:hypothetical protein